jgi:TolA-binding protein
LFNYAKITYEISYSPFSETIKAFDKYISTYPNSERNNSAYQYLVQVYMVTHNYADAINSIEKIMVRNPALNNAYQRVTFYRGLELFNDQDYNGAVKCFEKSLGISTGSRDFVIRSIFWKAEALYRIGDYNSAISEYNRFVLMPGASSILEYQDAQYNLAYAYFKLEDYTTANSFFRKFLNASQGKRTDKIADALNRVGDCYFLARDYTEAVKNYSQSYGMKIYDPDYSLFQIALCEGLERKYEEKITHLRTLLNDYRTSDYRDDALYELGRAYERTAQNSEALALYNDIVTNYKQSSYYKKALVQLGLIYYNNKNNSESLKYYKEVVEKFPNTDEATAALNGIKNNYIDLNNLDTYFEYARQLGKGDISTTEQDALIYQAAEKRFMAGDKDAITQFKRYLNDFPYGAYVLNAHFYLGEALYNNGNYSESKEHYDYVARQSDNIFSEPAVAKMAELTFEARDYENALKLFKRLETLSGSPFNTLKAYAGQMDCNFELKKYQDAVTTAQKVREAEKADDQLLRDADYILAKSYYNLENWELALTGFKKLATETKSAQGAEAKYIVSELLFRKQQLKPAEKEILDFIDKGTPHKFWLGKSFLLLSDIYHASGDDFQAKHTLKSVVENYGDNSDGIVQEASGKLAAIEAKEKSDQDAAKKNPVEIKINNK